MLKLSMSLLFLFHSSTSDFVSLDSVKPSFIETPIVKIVGERFDTQLRIFPIGTSLQLTCKGEVGSNPSQVRAYM